MRKNNHRSESRNLVGGGRPFERNQPVKSPTRRPRPAGQRLNFVRNKQELTQQNGLRPTDE